MKKISNILISLAYTLLRKPTKNPFLMIFYPALYAGLFTLLLVISCVDKEKPAVFNEQEEMGKIRRSIYYAIGWAQTKDSTLLFSVLANDSTYFEINPNGEFLKGISELRKNMSFFMNPGFKAIRCDTIDLRIRISKSKDVAWFACILNDINEWKGQPASWENTRWSGVLEKRGDNWVVVQQHFSFPVND